MTDTAYTVVGVTYYRQGPIPQTIEGHFPLSYSCTSKKSVSVSTLLVKADNLEAAKRDLEHLCNHWCDNHYDYTPAHIMGSTSIERDILEWVAACDAAIDLPKPYNKIRQHLKELTSLATPNGEAARRCLSSYRSRDWVEEIVQGWNK